MHRSFLRQCSFSSGRSFLSGPRILDKSGFLGLDGEADDEAVGIDALELVQD